jgi:ankyrin repeat protein
MNAPRIAFYYLGGFGLGGPRKPTIYDHLNDDNEVEVRKGANGFFQRPDEVADKLSVAAARGKMKSLRVLLDVPGCDPKACASAPLRYAAEHGHFEAVKALLPASDPLAHKSGAMRHAATKGHMDILALLLPVSDFSKINHSRVHPKCKALVAEWQCRLDREELGLAIADPSTPAVKSRSL